jgi:high-affinity Fe2+/Pb2+ permease
MSVEDTNIIVASVVLGLLVAVFFGQGGWLFFKYSKHAQDYNTQDAVLGHKETTLAAVNSYAPLMGHTHMREVANSLAVHP